jgi:nitroimidazol reductase NimA-like FMN-containing flavoprotein (pyridoxamine 5'-phosphate oxidase superfamily)
MFRELTRIKQKLSQEESIDLLKQQPRGVLSLIGDDGYPYGVPIDHWYNEADGKIYFHSGREGHKVDAIYRCNKASFCVCDEGVRKEGDWALHIKSVIVFGRIHIVEDHTKALELTRQLSLKYTRDEDYIQKEIDSYGSEVLVFALEPEHITGKITKES